MLKALIAIDWSVTEPSHSLNYINQILKFEETFKYM